MTLPQPPQTDQENNEDSVETWEGTHGTCRSRALAIEAANKFIPPDEPGLRGTGIYFWVGEYRVVLAREWHEKRLSDGDFRHDSDPGQAFITSKVECHEDNRISLSDPDVVMTLERITMKYRTLSREQMAKVYDELIDRLEAKMTTSYHVVFDKVPPPDLNNSRFPKHLSWPLCMVVRHAPCIKSIDVSG